MTWTDLMHTNASPTELTRLMRMAFELANARVLADIRTRAVRVQLPNAPLPGQWYDTRPMTDPRETPPPELDMAQLALAFARDAGLVTLHPLHPYLVCIVNPR